MTYSQYVASFLCLISGSLLFYVGLFFSKLLFDFSILLILIGWGIGFFALFKVYYTAPVKNKRYETFLNIALLAGGLGMLTYLIGSLTEQWWLINDLIQIGPWLFLVPIFSAVSHRMIPYFTSTVLADYRVVQPNWSLPIISICAIGHGVLSIDPKLWGWRVIFDAPFLLLVIHHSYHWKLLRSLPIQLLAILHIAFLWLGIALLLYTVQDIWLLINNQLIFARAPLHALTIGFMISMVIAMVSRVTLGHSGRFLVADRLTWLCFLGISVVALLRILAEVQILNFPYLNTIAAILGLIILTFWVSTYLPMVLKARVDGNPG